MLRIPIFHGHRFKSQLPSQQSRHTAIDNIHCEALDIIHVLGLCLAHSFEDPLFFLAGQVDSTLKVEGFDNEVECMGELGLGELPRDIGSSLNDW